MNPELRRDPKSYYKIVCGQKVEKVKYKTEKEALAVATYWNLQPHTIHKVIIYKCPVCGYWHTGKSHKELTEKDRAQAAYRLKYFL